MSIYRIIGVVLAVLGLMAAVFPSWFGPLTAEATADIFEAIERRIRGGMVMGVGLALIGITSLRPWSVSIPSAVMYIVLGALIARFIGIVLDGSVPKQWLWVAVETLIMTVAALWLWRSSASG